MQTRTNFDTPALLAQVPLFNSLGDDELARLARGTRELTAARGEILFHKGDAPSGFYLILDGQVKLALTSARGNEKSKKDSPTLWICCKFRSKRDWDSTLQ